MGGEDRYDLNRFVAAQDADGTYKEALGELRCGQKTSHWMWIVFPQIAGLGYSAISRRFAIRSLDEATAYLQHPVLGPRLIECSKTVAESKEESAERIFGVVDAQQLQSSMTLFMRADLDDPIFGRVLAHYFDGQPNSVTDSLLGV